MLLIPIDLTRTEQPQDGSRFDPAHPLAARFHTVYMPAVSAANLGIGGAGGLASHAAPDIALPDAMRAASIVATNQQLTASRSYGPTPTYPITMIWVGRQGSNVNTILSNLAAASGISGSYWYVGGGSSTIVGLSARNSFGSALSLTVSVPGGSALDTELVIVAQSLAANDHRLCVNGSAVATASTNIGSMVAWDRVAIGQPSAANNQATALLAVASGGAALSDSQMQQLSRNAREVYALFEPQRIWVPVSTVGGGSYTLQVTPGSYSITVNDVSLIAARSVQVTQGSYAITGNDVGLAAGVVLSALTGAYAYAGNDVGLTASRQLAVTAGSYSITGNVAGLNAARLLTATPGAYSISGNSVILTYNTVGSYTLNVTAGSYAITGNDVALTASRTLAVTAGSYSTTGSDVVLTYGVMHTLNVTPGAYAITGYSAMLAKALTLQALAGAYAYTGRNVVLTYSGLADGALDVVHLLSRVTPNVQLLAALTQTVRLQGHVPEFAGLSSPIP